MNLKFYIATIAIVIIAGDYMVANEQSKKLNRLNDANKEIASRLEELVNIRAECSFCTTTNFSQAWMM